MLFTTERCGVNTKAIIKTMLMKSSLALETLV